MLTLVLADDHQIVRQGLRAILRTEADFQLVGEASDGLETVRLVERLQPHVLIADLMMPGLNGFEVTRQVVRRVPRTRVVVLSMHSDIAYVREAVNAGATGYVVKEAGAEELVEAVRAAAEGRPYFSHPFAATALEPDVKRPRGTAVDPYGTLTAREREVLQLTVEGHSGAEISERLFISPRTVESHRANLMRKLRVRNQKELVRYAVLRGILPTEN